MAVASPTMSALLSNVLFLGLLREDQQQAPVAAETQRRVMRLRISPTAGFGFNLMLRPQTRKVASNIRWFAQLVNEMGIQSFHRDISAFLRRRCKTDGSILRDHSAKVPARGAFRTLSWINSAHRCTVRLLPPRPKSS